MGKATVSSSADIDIPAGEYIIASAAWKHYPVTCNRATAWRHMLQGIKRAGETVRLKTLIVGGRRFTTSQWIAEFVEALNRDNPTQRPSSVMTENQRARQAAAAMTALKAMGIPERRC